MDAVVAFWGEGETFLFSPSPLYVRGRDNRREIDMDSQ